MTHAISLIYGDHLIDDHKFYDQQNEVIDRYSHGIMTLQGSPMKTLEAVALNPASVPRWKQSLETHPEDCGVLQNFFTRLINHCAKTGKLKRTNA